MSRAGRQGPVDTQRCFYADDPTSRPECTLTAVVRYDTTVLCANCQPRRSTIGKGTAAVALPAGTALDVLDWVGAAQDQAAVAQRTLTASVTRARHAGHSWTAISTRLGITRQAAQQRFGTPTDTRGREETTRSRDKEVTAD
jgi:hypothetical protein